jgi:hypothetical protein
LLKSFFTTSSTFSNPALSQVSNTWDDFKIYQLVQGLPWGQKNHSRNLVKIESWSMIMLQYAKLWHLTVATAIFKYIYIFF